MEFSRGEQNWLPHLHAEWNNREIRELTKQITNVETVVDIGACFGFSVLHWNNSLSPKIIYAFEPTSRNVEIIKFTCRHLTNLTVFQNAVYYCDEEYLDIQLNREKPGNHSLEIIRNSNLMDEAHRNDFPETTERVKIVKLEDVINFTPDLIKIDVEGAEFNIIENSTIFKEAKYLWVEWHEWMNGGKQRPDYIDNFMKKYLPNHNLFGMDKRRSMLLKRK
jgi:FkbM family methyltransferase